MTTHPTLTTAISSVVYVKTEQRIAGQKTLGKETKNEGNRRPKGGEEDMKVKRRARDGQAEDSRGK